jgi:hypothetical protein
VSLVYWALRRVLELLVLRVRSERTKEIEILVLRQQLRLLERQVARPRPEPADRVLLATLSRVLPRSAWPAFLVTPATLLRWHRELVARRWTYPHRRLGRPETPGDVREVILRLVREKPGLGLPAHPGRAGRARDQDRGQHRLGDPAARRDRAVAAPTRIQLEGVSAPAGGEHPRVRLPHRRHRLPQALLNSVRDRASEPSRPPGRDHRESRRGLGDPAGAQPADAARRLRGAGALPHPGQRQQIHARLRRSLPLRRHPCHQGTRAGATGHEHTPSAGSAVCGASASTGC